MGPASLPTPLSPIRGRVPSTEVQGTQTWHPMFSHPFRPKTSLQVLSPALAPASGSTLHSARFRPRHDLAITRLPGPAALQRAVPQPGFPLMAGTSSGHIAFRSEDLYTMPPSASGRVGHAHNRTPSYFRHRPALRRSKLLCMRVSRGTRTGSAASSRFRISNVFQVVRPSRPEAFFAVPMN